MRHTKYKKFALTVCTLAVASTGITAHAQTLGGTMVAVGAGATLGAAAGGFRPASQIAAPATNSLQRRQNDLINEAGNAGAPGGGGGQPGAATNAVPAAGDAIQWSDQTGFDRIGELLKGRKSIPRYRVRAQGLPRSAKNRADTAYIMRIISQAKRPGDLSKYQIASKGWLSYYMKEDRYKVLSKLWRYVTTPNDRFYHEPWDPQLKNRDPSKIIGFHTWQDAMIAGYRPDPRTWPAPAPELFYLAMLSPTSQMSHYAEFVYSGQITPQSFDRTIEYTRYVAGQVASRPDTRPFMSYTIGQVLGGMLGENEFPTQVGGEAYLKLKAAEEQKERKKNLEEFQNMLAFANMIGAFRRPVFQSYAWWDIGHVFPTTYYMGYGV